MHTGAAVTPELQWELREIDGRCRATRTFGGFAACCGRRCDRVARLQLLAPAVVGRGRVRSRDGPAHRQLERACALAAEHMPLPHCVVFLAAAAAGVPSASDTEGLGTAATAEPPHDRRTACELAYQLSQPGQGPVLPFPAATCGSLLSELTAAIDAMRLNGRELSCKLIPRSWIRHDE